MTQFVGANNTGARLPDYKDRVVALGYREDTTIPTAEYGPSEATRARFLAITDEGPQDLGETLVFQSVLRNKLRGENGNMVVGKLVEVQHKSRRDEDGTPWTYYDLEPLGETTQRQAIESFQSLLTA